MTAGRAGCRPRGSDGFFRSWSNIHYGYVGRPAGFSALELHGGAGLAQIKDHHSQWSYWKSWGDDPSDAAAIDVGIELWDNNHLNITPSIFMQVFDKYASRLQRRLDTSSGGGGTRFE